jgi:hypothetical protein
MFSETSVDFQRTTWRYIPKDSTLQGLLQFGERRRDQNPSLGESSTLENLANGENILVGTPLGEYLVDQDSDGRILRRWL